MCGITGFSPATCVDSAESVIRTMTATLRHRGPDDSGSWRDDQTGMVLGHRRLSVLDLSLAGHQPMVSACGRYVIVFNGEIYNHLELRTQLECKDQAPAWRGHADTETLLACFSAWSIEATLKAIVGMFAIALWDRRERVLTLARDRMGEKPLYYGWRGGTFLFGSELKALKVHPAFDAEIDRGALALMMRYGYIPAPYSIYQNIYKLRPGHYLHIPLEQSNTLRQMKSEAYWRLNAVVEDGQATPFSGNAEEAADLLEKQLSNSINMQRLADVPLGVFLSGGVDSSTVVALMQAQSSLPVRTFTIGFAETGYDEAQHAKAVAQHLGTKHTELYVRPQDAQAVIPDLSSIYSEPFADSSQIPTYLVSQLACRHVTVALSGDGGDEMFGGYNRYLAASKLWGRLQRMPLSLRKMAAGMMSSLPPSSWDRVFDIIMPLFPRRFHVATPGDKVQKLSGVMGLSDGHAFFHRVTSQWNDPARVVLDGCEPSTQLTSPHAWPKTDSLEHWMMAMDAQTYLADDILVKVDRAAMANSLETRVPILDHRVVELAWRMPLDMKIAAGQGKWLLRQVLYRHVPKALIERPKMGFTIPLNNWLRGQLRDWAEALLYEGLLRRQGFFHPQPIQAMWQEHLSGTRNWQSQLWCVLMFQAWLNDNK